MKRIRQILRPCAESDSNVTLQYAPAVELRRVQVITVRRVVR